MPTYSYECKKCAHVFDVFHAINAQPRMKCPVCNGPSKRLLGKGAGVIFKGSGFYETDYKKAGAKAEKSGGADSGSKTETKSESKPESRSKSETSKAAKD